jgi:hypothetical protein
MLILAIVVGIVLLAVSGFDCSLERLADVHVGVVLIPFFLRTSSYLCLIIISFFSSTLDNGSLLYYLPGELLPSCKAHATIPGILI